MQDILEIIENNRVRLIHDAMGLVVLFGVLLAALNAPGFF